MCPDIYADRVHIYVSGRAGPVTTLSRLELASRSRLLHRLLTSLNLCDGCTQPLALVLAGEEAGTVEAALSQVAVFNKRAGVSIIQEPKKVTALLQRLEIQKCYNPSSNVECSPPVLTHDDIPPDSHLPTNENCESTGGEETATNQSGDAGVTHQNIEEDTSLHTHNDSCDTRKTKSCFSEPLSPSNHISPPLPKLRNWRNWVKRLEKSYSQMLAPKLDQSISIVYEAHKKSTENCVIVKCMIGNISTEETDASLETAKQKAAKGMLDKLENAFECEYDIIEMILTGKTVMKMGDDDSFDAEEDQTSPGCDETPRVEVVDDDLHEKADSTERQSGYSPKINTPEEENDYEGRSEVVEESDTLKDLISTDKNDNLSLVNKKTTHSLKRKRSMSAWSTVDTLSISTADAVRKSRVKMKLRRKSHQSYEEPGEDSEDSEAATVDSYENVCGVCEDEESFFQTEDLETTYDWIECSSCPQWFHQDCVGLEEARKKEIKNIKFICYMCSGPEEPCVIVKTNETKIRQTSGIFKCHQCKMGFHTKSLLYQHYSTVHYKSQLRSLLGSNKSKCPYCSKSFKQPIHLLAHVGGKHRKIEAFLPEEYHLSKVRRRRDNQTSETTFQTAQNDGGENHFPKRKSEAKVQNLINETESAVQESSIEKDYKGSHEKMEMGLKISSVETASDWNTDYDKDNEIDEHSLEVDTKMQQEFLYSDNAPLEGNSYTKAENVPERYSEDDIRKILDSDSEED